MSQPPRRRPPQQQDPRRSNPPRSSADYEDYEYDEYPPQRNKRPAPGSGPQRGGAYYQQRPRYVQQKRDMFPMLMGGLIGAMIIGIGLIIILLLQANNSVSPSIGGPVASATPPRMPIDDFKKLYDNPSTRPMIIDVRALDAYKEGHIVGALSMPESDIDKLVAQIPKDKLVVAYCQ